MPLTAFSSRVFSVFEVQDLFLPIKIWNRLCDHFIFNFFLLCHILIGNNSVYLCDRLNFNPFIYTFVHLTIAVFTWYNLTSYSIVLQM